MFDKNSDYARNKRADAIVYIKASGAPALLTRADFSSEDEYLRWKLWSNAEYKQAEQSGRSFFDNCISLDESLDCVEAVASVEDELIGRINETEYAQHRAALMEKVKNILTRKQYRRLWKLHVDGFTMTAIAVSEGVTEPSVSERISRAEKNISIFF